MNWRKPVSSLIHRPSCTIPRGNGGSLGATGPDMQTHPHINKYTKHVLPFRSSKSTLNMHMSSAGTKGIQCNIWENNSNAHYEK